MLQSIRKKLSHQKHLQSRRKASPFRQSAIERFFKYPPRSLSAGFALVIVLGTFLLSLPQASDGINRISIIDALFTATSATCVTGLIVVDTGTAFSTFGQIIILILIQLGGLGIMTFSTFFVFLVSGKLSLSDREILIDTMSQNPTAELTGLLKIVFMFTLAIEAIGFGLLTLGFSAYFPWGEAIYQGLFHSVSAFCNAGFSLFSDSMMGFSNNVLINGAVMVLIVLGGLGFIVILDVYNNRKFLIGKKGKRLRFHTRLVMISTLSLILFGALGFMILEYSNALNNMSFFGKIMVSFFQSITTRTAGFNSVSVNTMTNVTLFLFIILMFIGASPGSCGGGIKTTTFVVLLASIYNRLSMREDVTLMYRRIPSATFSRSISIIFFSMIIIILFTVVLLIFEVPLLPHTQTRGRFLEVLFEVVSAFGTVGLSTGITGTLTDTGKILITILMFLGRLGPLTIAVAIGGKMVSPHYKYMQEDVMVG
ncbi:MAG: Trk family potassium uptake protein [Caldithrix sp.]|nr:Trk family potassium uptake protein [Caldithrix sp.]